MQRPAIVALRDLRFRAFGVFQRDIRRHFDECVQLRIERFDAREQRAGELDRRKLARVDQAREFGDGQIVQIGGHGSLLEMCGDRITASSRRRAVS